MKTKTKFLIKQSLAKKINTKWFKVVNVLLLVLLVLIVNIDTIINAFGGDFKTEKTIYVIDNVGVYDKFNTYFNTIKETVSDMANYELQSSEEKLDDLTKKLEEEKENIVIAINPSVDNYMEAEVYSYNALELVVKELINSSLGTVKSEYALEQSNIDPNVLASVSAPINIENIVTNPDASDSEAKDIMSMGVIMIFLIPFFILIVILVQMIGAEINDEKATRGMEIIISNVSPKAHLFSKIISSTLFSILQLLLMLGYGAVALGIRFLINGNFTTSALGSSFDIKGIIDMLKNSGMLALIVKSLPAVLVLFILSFLIYALLASILASMTTNIEDYQQLQTPLMILLMAGYYLGLMASVFDGAIFIKIVSFMPFLSALVAPTLFWLGETTIWELWLSVGILLATCIVIFRYGIRVYKVGILNYSSKDLWKKVFKSLKNKEEV